MVESVDTRDLKSLGHCGCGGSSPPSSTFTFLISLANQLICEGLFFILQDTLQGFQDLPRPMYIMNRDGFSLLVMGFTGKKALDFKLELIEAFNTMESALKEKTFHPGRMIPTECIVLTCTDKSGKDKHLHTT